MLKIVLIGPESTGKSTLSAQLADYYHTVWVREFAREYIEGLKRPYEETDLLKIAKGQIELEEEALKTEKRIVFFDTNLIVIKVWSLNAYKSCDNWILKENKSSKLRFIFLCVE